jgi:hypothetical protein
MGCWVVLHYRAFWVFFALVDLEEKLHMAKQPTLSVSERTAAFAFADHPYSPALFNSTAGLLSTIVNVYITQKGSWSVTAKVTVAATGSCVCFSGLALFLYSRKIQILQLIEQIAHPSESLENK